LILELKSKRSFALTRKASFSFNLKNLDHRLFNKASNFKWAQFAH